MTDDNLTRTAKQFGPIAGRYARETGFDPDIGPIVEVARPTPTDRALDVGTGAGHALLALAPHIASGVGLDATPEMLDHARELAASRNASNVEWVVGSAQALPFGDGAFQIVTCRVCAHHFADPARFVREAARVLSPGGRLVLADNYAPDDPTADAWINELDKTRDPSHHRAWRIAEWETFFRDAGLGWSLLQTWEKAVDTASWLDKAEAALGARARVWELLATPPPQAAECFSVRSTPPEFSLLKFLAVGER